jgi:protein-S-isoprenylcysteine O-methyltransferase Ste14
MIDASALLSLGFLASACAAVHVAYRKLGRGAFDARLLRAAVDLLLSGPVFEGWVFPLAKLPFDLYVVQTLLGVLFVASSRRLKNRPAAWMATGAFFAAWIIGATVLLTPEPRFPPPYALLAARIGLFLYVAMAGTNGRANALRSLFHALVVLPALAETPFLVGRLLNLPVAAPGVFRTIAASAALSAGLVLMAMGVREFSKGSASPDPSESSDRLLTEGIYSYLRNPIQIAQVLIIAAGVIFKGGHGIVFGVAALEAGFLVFLIRPIEEWHLESRFGDEYRAYRARVPAYIPRKESGCLRRSPM